MLFKYESKPARKPTFHVRTPSRSSLPSHSHNSSGTGDSKRPPTPTFRPSVLGFTALYIFALIFIVCPSLLTVANLPFRLAAHLTSGQSSSPSDQQPYGDALRVALKVVTLAVNTTADDRATIDHNCALLSGTAHTYEIHTDTPDQPYCKHCRCVVATQNARPPLSSSSSAPCAGEGCEKMEFLLRTIETNAQFAFIESDLLLLRRDYFDILAARTHDFDFLAMYDDDARGGPCNLTYTTGVSLGVMFVRRMGGLDYSEVRGMTARSAREGGGGGDVDYQGVLSAFVMRRYRRWDTLNLKWQCGAIGKKGRNIRAEECFAFHGRGERLRGFLRQANRTMLHTEDLH